METRDAQLRGSAVEKTAGGGWRKEGFLAGRRQGARLPAKQPGPGRAMGAGGSGGGGGPWTFLRK